MEVHQFATSLAYGDAISDEILEIQKILRDKGHNSEIFIRFYDPRMAKYITDYREYKRFSSPLNVVIFHFSISSPVSKMFFRIPDKKIMIYHNITPHEYFLDSHRILTRECYKGRLEIKLFVNKVDLALGDSEFNRQELEKVGYPKTGILPLLLDFKKFNIEGDPITDNVYSNRKATILFVGRIIPNKKYEDIIKAFYFYQKYFNKNSQLILVGDYRGLERYYTGLQDLVKRFELSDVCFTGHVEFPELVSFYKLSDLYLSLSEHEGFGVPLLEAFYMRVPVVAYPAGAVEETMNGGGVLIRRKDFLRIAALMDTIISDRSIKSKIVNSQLKALDKYQKENISRILLGHIERVYQG
ncbi:MAG: glycosyltransferase family 4 protein [Candidatus Aminicenantaceae bacterium]